MSFRQTAKRWFEYSKKFSDKINENHIFAYASQASYFVIISAVPFLMLLLNLIRAFLPVTPEYFENLINTFLPIQIRDIAYRIIEDFFDVNIPLISVTSVFLVWSASRGVKAISSGIKIVFDTDDNQGYIISSFWSLVYTILFMVSLVVSVAVLLFGGHISEFIVSLMPKFKPVSEIILGFRYLILLIFLTLVFMGAYKFLGKTKISFHRHFFGAALSAGSWLIFSYFYSLYILNISNMSYIYGSLAAVIFLMLWLWFCMIILLFGAQVNMWLYERDISIILLIKKQLRKNRNKKSKKIAKN